MRSIASIVEGHGEVSAFPVLLSRLMMCCGDEYFNIQRPIRVHKDKLIRRDGELERYIELARRECGDDGWIFVLVDADDACPVELGKLLLDKIQDIGLRCGVSVVIANREYEAWFIASRSTLDGCRGFVDSGGDVDPDSPRNAKKWVEERMIGRSYSETKDQAAFPMPSISRWLVETVDHSENCTLSVSGW